MCVEPFPALGKFWHRGRDAHSSIHSFQHAGNKGEPQVRRAMEYATWHQKLENFKGVHDRKTVLVGLSGITELYSAVPALMIRVLLLPPADVHKQRWTQRDQEAAAQFKASLRGNSSKKRSQAYGVSALPPIDKYIAAQAMFDVVVKSVGCAEQSLVDLVAGVFQKHSRVFRRCRFVYFCFYSLSDRVLDVGVVFILWVFPCTA